MLMQAGYLEGPKPVRSGSGGPPFIAIKDMTWDGHDFIAALENETVWSQIKQKLSPSELAGLPLGIIKDAGLGMLKAYIMNKLGS